MLITIVPVHMAGRARLDFWYRNFSGTMPLLLDLFDSDGVRSQTTAVTGSRDELMRMIPILASSPRVDRVALHADSFVKVVSANEGSDPEGVEGYRPGDFERDAATDTRISDALSTTIISRDPDQSEAILSVYVASEGSIHAGRRVLFDTPGEAGAGAAILMGEMPRRVHQGLSGTSEDIDSRMMDFLLVGMAAYGGAVHWVRDASRMTELSQIPRTLGMPEGVIIKEHGDRGSVMMSRPDPTESWLELLGCLGEVSHDEGG